MWKDSTQVSSSWYLSLPIECCLEFVRIITVQMSGDPGTQDIHFSNQALLQLNYSKLGFYTDYSWDKGHNLGTQFCVQNMGINCGNDLERIIKASQNHNCSASRQRPFDISLTLLRPLLVLIRVPPFNQREHLLENRRSINSISMSPIFKWVTGATAHGTRIVPPLATGLSIETATQQVRANRYNPKMVAHQPQKNVELYKYSNRQCWSHFQNSTPGRQDKLMIL